MQKVIKWGVTVGLHRKTVFITFYTKNKLNFFAVCTLNGYSRMYVDIMKKFWSFQIANMDIIFGQFLHPPGGREVIITGGGLKYHYFRPLRASLY